MSEPIEPALTPEEWRQVAESGCVPHDGGDGFSALLWYGNRHMAAAVALYGQPFGFTEDERDKLARLSEALDDFDTGWLYSHGEPYEAALRVVVAKIAALLPPEGE